MNTNGPVFQRRRINFQFFCCMWQCSGLMVWIPILLSHAIMFGHHPQTDWHHPQTDWSELLLVDVLVVDVIELLLVGVLVVDVVGVDGEL